MISIDYITLTAGNYGTGKGSFSRKRFYMIGAGFIKSLLGIKISEVENIEVKDKSTEDAILAVYFKNGKKFYSSPIYQLIQKLGQTMKH
ncbi:hypothetical protein DM558_08735 [Entomomonas moraniae]|uniref:Uncharacterized protein n=1 Tax=Entomomonas moraniae TaxID=2213226 RepID=A0A3Q9JJD6_9GAMM|nr:hypothetical protein [Entomomonas moraniae]AZS50862.1 hypothetical protein DM558_08735 [Entomomonas moraniae]